MVGDHGIAAGRQNVGRQRAGILLHHVAGGGEDGPFGVGQRLAAERLDELEGGLRARLLEGRLGDLAGLDRHVGAHLGVGVAIEAFDAVGAGIQPRDDAGLGVVENHLPIAELILLVREYVEANRAVGQRFAVGQHGGKLQSSGVEDKGFLERAAALNFDLLGEIGEAVSGIDQIFPGNQRGGRHGLAVGAEQLETAALRRGLRRIDAPGQPRLQSRPLLADQGFEGDGYRQLDLRRGRRRGRGDDGRRGRGFGRGDRHGLHDLHGGVSDAGAGGSLAGVAGAGLGREDADLCTAVSRPASSAGGAGAAASLADLVLRSIGLVAVAPGGSASSTVSVSAA